MVQWLLIDLEHGAIDDAQMYNMVPAIRAVPCCHPIIRVPTPSSEHIKRALDAGAHGLMIPTIETAVSWQSAEPDCATVLHY